MPPTERPCDQRDHDPTLHHGVASARMRYRERHPGGHQRPSHPVLHRVRRQGDGLGHPVTFTVPGRRQTDADVASRRARRRDGRLAKQQTTGFRLTQIDTRDNGVTRSVHGRAHAGRARADTVGEWAASARWLTSPGGPPTTTRQAPRIISRKAPNPADNVQTVRGWHQRQACIDRAIAVHAYWRRILPPGARRARAAISALDTATVTGDFRP